MNTPSPHPAGDARPLVLHVIHKLDTGGLENGLVNLINRLPQPRFRHAVACVTEFTDFRLRIRHADVPVLALHRDEVGVWAMRLKLFKLCRQMRPTIVHTRGQSGLDALLPARLAGVRRTVHGEHGWDMDDLRGQRTKPVLLRRLHRPLVDRYIAVSQDLAHYLRSRVQVPAGRITTICNGVDTDRFQPAAQRWLQRLPAGFADQHCLLIGTVGRLVPVKNQAALLRAFARLVSRNDAVAPTLRLVLVGGGPLMGELQALAVQLGVVSRTWFAGDQSDVPPLLQLMDLFVLPSHNEGISNTVLEAMASGLPVVATRVGGNVELVRDGVNGALVPVGDDEALTAALARYVDDPALRLAHATGSRQLAVQNFSLGHMVQQYQAVYDGLLAQR